MGVIHGLRARVRALVRPDAADRELAEEIRHHIELETANNLRLVMAGLIVGGGAALLSTRVMAKLLYHVAPNDPLTLGGVAVLLAATGVVASWIPALRASRADPMLALRSD